MLITIGITNSVKRNLSAFHLKKSLRLFDISIMLVFSCAFGISANQTLRSTLAALK
jgi:hypothetical protein